MNKFTRQAAVSLLWVASAAISTWFWFSLADGFTAYIMGAAALGLEFGKLEAWKTWTDHRRPEALFMGLVLTALSLTASAGLTLDLLQHETANTQEETAALDRWQANLDRLDADRRALETERDRLPAGWVTSRLRLTQGIADLDAQRRQLETMRPPSPAPAGGESLRRALGETIGVDPATLALAMVAVLALALEGALILFSGSETQEAERGTAFRAPSVPDTANLDSDAAEYWKASYQGRGKPLRGRHKIEKELDLTVSRIRKAHRTILSTGLVSQVGNRLFATI